MPSFTLRSYQARIVSQIAERNGIVLLPTGAGKTAIAGEMIRKFRGRKVLFLVPTILLVEQQAEALREWSDNVAQYHGGGVSLPTSSFRVLVSTPKAFLIAQAKHPQLFGWEEFGQVVFDEVHHVLKDHPYRKIAMNLNTRAARIEAARSDNASGAKCSGSEKDIQILGLTASMSYAVEESKIRKSIERLIRELAIDVIGTASKEELEQCGYFGNNSTAEVAGESLTSLECDEVDIICEEELALSAVVSETANAPVPLAERKPHLMIPTFWARVAAGTCTPFARKLLDRVFEEENLISSMDPTFVSPLGMNPLGRESKTGKPAKMSDWAEYAKKRRDLLFRKNPLKVIDFTGHGSLSPWALRAEPCYWNLEQLYEALRFLICSWEENVGSAIMFLKMMTDCAVACKHLSSTGLAIPENFAPANVCGAPGSLASSLGGWVTSQNVDDYKRLQVLKRTLLDKFEQHDEFRGIVFVQQRVSAHILVYFLEKDQQTAAMFRCAPLYATSSPATPSLSVTKSHATSVLKDFLEGRINLLVSTVVAEEGMDIPAANCVIRYDPVLNAVSHVQGRGRARQTDSSFVVLSERQDRPVELLQAVETKQAQVAMQIANVDIGDEDPMKTQLRTAELQEKERSAQKSREKNASSVFENIADENAVANLNLYAKKTKVEISEVYEKIPEGFECKLEYSSCLRLVKASGKDSQKKSAKRKAAISMLHRLRDEKGS